MHRELKDPVEKQLQYNLYRHVETRIRDRRKELGISQARISELLNVSYQQIQKYEAGQNQVSVARLLQFARILNVPAEYFYEGAPSDEEIGARIETDIIQKTRPHALQILLVEDSPADALLFERAAKAFGSDINIICLADSDKIIEKIKSSAEKKPIDLIVLDLNMPKLNGLQTLKNIKSNSQTSDIPVVVLTNSTSKKEMAEAYRLGSAGFMQKVVNFKEFEHNVKTMIDYWLQAVCLPIRE